MRASKDKNLYEASDTIFRLSADSLIRKQCRDREEYYQDLRNYERVIAEKDASIAKKTLPLSKKMRCLEKRSLRQKDFALYSKSMGLWIRGKNAHISLSDIFTPPFHVRTVLKFLSYAL